jgi:hypothetical protein
LSFVKDFEVLTVASLEIALLQLFQEKKIADNRLFIDSQPRSEHTRHVAEQGVHQVSLPPTTYRPPLHLLLQLPPHEPSPRQEARHLDGDQQSPQQQVLRRLPHGYWRKKKILVRRKKVKPLQPVDDQVNSRLFIALILIGTWLLDY